MDFKKKVDNKQEAPGMDPDEAFGENASETEKETGEYTTVTRLTYDEYDPSEK